MDLATFPLNIFTTQRMFNDYGADDMRYGDICERRMKNEFGLTHISNVIDPWNMTRLHPFHNPQSRFAGAYAKPGEKLSPLECARLLFAEMQTTSLPFALVGPQRFLINKMLEHFMRSSGLPFRDLSLDMAYRDKIMNDRSINSTHKAIIDTLNVNIDFGIKGLPLKNIGDINSAINNSILPKFDSFIMDKINGLGITVHDVYATKIDILSLDVNGARWRAKMRFSGQDHFGLDTHDIHKHKFRQFQFFKIWFTLQRYDKFGFRPFLTNMDAVIDIEGGR